MSDAQPGEPDPRTLIQFRSGGVTALAAVFELYGGRIHRLARRIMGNEADAEDATQEIFLRAFEQAHLFKGRSSLFTWLYRLAVRHCLNMLKQRKRRDARLSAPLVGAAAACAETAASPLDTLLDQERRELGDGLLQSLPADQRACLLLREVEGLSYAQIADCLGVRPGTAMSRLARARQALRERLRATGQWIEISRNKSDAAVVQSIQERMGDDLR